MHRERRPRATTWLIAISQCLFLGVLILLGASSWGADEAQAAPCDEPVLNAIACENTKPGSPPSEWDISGAGSSNIQGFATNMSVDRGQTVDFKVDTNSSDYRLDIYRMGYYDGDGARACRHGAALSVAAPEPTQLP